MLQRRSYQLTNTWFDDWKNNHIINDHGNNSEHKECISKFINLTSQIEDGKIAELYKEQAWYYRTVDVIGVGNFLVSPRLPIHGDNEILGCVRNWLRRTNFKILSLSALYLSLSLYDRNKRSCVPSHTYQVQPAVNLYSQRAMRNLRL